MNDTSTKYLTNDEILTIRNTLNEFIRGFNLSISKTKEVISTYYSNQMLKNLINVGGFGEEKMKELEKQMEMCDKISELMPNLKSITEEYLSIQEKLNNIGTNN